MNNKTEEQFKKYLKLSDSLRNNYSRSLGLAEKENNNLNFLPITLQTLYSKVKGTHYELEDQSLMDFIPGFLLIHITEYNHFKNKMISMLNDEKNNYFPILVNYSSDFYAIKIDDKTDKGVFLINHDELNPIKIHNSLDDFLSTLIAFYEEKVYFLDKDGYLDMDFDKEEEVAQTLNPDIPFWFEE